MFKRLICCIKGHKPFPRRDIPETPQPSLPYTLGTIGGSGVVLTSTTTGALWSDEKTFQINRGPFNASFAICARCQNVYWSVEPYGPTVTSVSNLPEIQDYWKWKKRDVWEADQRQKNELANKLYQQYLVALKLGKADE